MNIKKIIILLMFAKVTIFVQLVGCDNDGRNYSNNGGHESVNDDNGSGALTKLRRSKRYLGFKKGSKIFLRVNGKENMFRMNQIFAHGFGFRANYDILYPEPKIHKVRRRDVHDSLEEMINQFGFDGRACVLRSICEASNQISPGTGMFLKLFRLIFRNTTREVVDSDGFDTSNRLPDGVEESRPYLKSNDCEELYSHCPLSLLELSSYTDEV